MRNAWLALLPVLALSCGEGGGDAGPPPIVVLSLDTLRADHLPSWGYARDTAPNLAAFAGEAVRFENASAQSCGTLPSHLSLITSRNPPHLRITRDDERNYDQHNTVLELPEGVLTLTEALKRAGYDTAAFTGGSFVGPRYGFARGFDHFRVVKGRARGRSEGFAQSLAALRLYLGERRRTADRDPLFLFLHTYDVHAPYDAPEPFSRRFSSATWADLERELGYRPMPSQLVMRLPSVSRETVDRLRDLYDNGIASADASFGTLMDVLRSHDLYDEAILVVLSDHGEEFLEHGFLGHGHSVHGELVRVPLLLRLPGGRHGGRVLRDPAALVDLAPSLLGLAGLAIPEEFRGRSLRERIERGGEDHGSAETRIYYESPNLRTGAYGMQRGRFKLVRHRDREDMELYDLSADPAEQRNLAGERGELRDELAAELAVWVTEMEDEGRRRGWHAVLPRAASRRQLADDEREARRAPGHLQPRAPAEPGRRLPNPAAFPTSPATSTRFVLARRLRL